MLIKMNYQTQKRSVLYLPRLLQISKQLKQTNHKHSFSQVDFAVNSNQREHTKLSSSNSAMKSTNDNEEWSNRIKTFTGIKLDVLCERRDRNGGEAKHHKAFSFDNLKLIKRNKGSREKRVKDNMIEDINKEFRKLDKEFKKAEVKCLKKIETAPILNIKHKQRFKKNKIISNHFKSVSTLKYAHNLSMIHWRVNSLNK